jgi:gamma-glutamylcyclotransferase
MKDDYVVTFAYGSNMLSARLQARVPSAKAIGIGQLRGHVLRWHKRSNDGSGKCDVQITDTETDNVWGVLFRFKMSEKADLDEAEGLNNGYAEKDVDILVGTKASKAQVYYATNKEPALRPYQWYKAFVVAGAREHHLPVEYLATLESMAAVPDLNTKRAAKNERLLSDWLARAL